MARISKVVSPISTEIGAANAKKKRVEPVDLRTHCLPADAVMVGEQCQRNALGFEMHNSFMRNCDGVSLPAAIAVPLQVPISLETDVQAICLRQ